MKNNFEINKNAKFLIYGAATTGGIIYENLIKSGYYVKGFIDKRADEIDSYYALPVWNINELNDELKEKENTIIILAIKNVFEHEDIANTLLEVNYRNIIYRPLDVIKSKGTKEEATLNKIYDGIIEGNIFEKISIPKLKAIKAISLQYDNILSKLDDEVVVRIPISFVFTDNDIDKKGIWLSISSWGLIPHINFFKKLSGKVEYDNNLYIDFCREAAKRRNIVTSKKWEKSVMDNRLDVYQNMELEMETETDFFVNNAPRANWNIKGYFNICSGKHRVVYQIIRKKRYIPLRITYSEYNKWINKEQADKVYSILKDNNIRNLKVPIMHPYFYSYPCKSSLFYYNFLEYITYSIYKYYYYKEREFNFNEKTILNIGKGNSKFSWFLAKLGFYVFVLENDDIDKNINIEIDKLYHVTNVEYKINISKIKEVDILIIDLNTSMSENISLNCNLVIVIDNNCEGQRIPKQWNKNEKQLLFCGYDGEEFKYVFLLS